MAGSSIVGILKVLLTADTAQYESAMKRTGVVAKQVQTDLGAIGRQATQLGSALTKTLTLPLLALGTGAAKLAMDFESSFAGVRKTVDATDAEFAAMAQAFRDLSKTIPVNVNELNRLGEAAGALGTPKAEIVDFARVMAMLGVTTNVTSDQAAESIAKIQNIFGAAGQDTERFASTLVALGNNGASTEQDILSLANRIASAGNAVGLSQGQVLGYAAAIANVGIEAEAGGSAMSKVLIDISQAVSKGGDALTGFARTAGLSSKAFAEAFRADAGDATRLFIEGLGRMKKEGGDLNLVISDLGFTEIRQSNLLRSLALSGDNVSNMLNIQSQAWRDNNALSIEAGKRFETTTSQMTLLWNRVKDVGITLGNALLPMIQATIQGLDALLPIVTTLADGFSKLPVPVQAGIVGFGLLVAAAGPVLFVVGQLVSAAGMVVGAFATTGIATRALTLAMVPLRAAFTGLLPVLTMMGPAIAIIATAFASWTIGKWIGEVTGLTDVVGRLSARFGELLGILPEGAAAQYKQMMAAQRAAEAAKDHAKALDQTGHAIKGVGQEAVKLGPPVAQMTTRVGQTEEQLKAAKKSADEFAKSLKDLGGASAITGAQEVVKQLAAMNGPLNVLPSKLKEMADRLRDGAEAAQVMGKVGLAGDYFKLAATLDPVIQFQQRYNVTLGEYVTKAHTAANATQDLWDQFHRLSGQAVKIGPLLKSNLDLSKLFVGFKDAVKQNLPDSTQWADAWSDIKTGLAVNLAQIPGTLARAFEGGGDIWGAIKSIGSQIGAGIGGSIGKALGGKSGEQIGAALGALVGPLMEGVKKLFGIGINEAVKKANKEIEKLRGELLNTHGTMAQLEAKANALGLSFQANWGHQGQAGLVAFTALMKEFEARLGAANTKFGDLFTQAKGLGIALPAALQASIQHLIDIGVITGDVATQFGALTGQTGVDFEKMQAAATKYGVDLGSLGPQFQSARLHASAVEIINDFQLLIAGGASVGGVLLGMKDEINALVNDSIKFGTEIPANMQPWIAELMRTGHLTDENGNKITDLTGIKFGEPIKTEFEKVTDALADLITKMDAFVAAIAEATASRTQHITREYHDPGPPAGWMDDPFAGGGQGGDRGFESGTFGRLGKWFGNFPQTGFATALHGLEAVVTPEQAVPFAMDVLGGAGAPSSGGPGPDLAVFARRIDASLRSGLERQADVIESAIRSAIAQLA